MGEGGKGGGVAGVFRAPKALVLLDERTSWEFQDEIQRVKQSFTLVLPQGYSYTTTWAHHAQVKGADLENLHYRWEMNDEPAINLEQVPMSPGEEALGGFLYPV